MDRFASRGDVEKPRKRIVPIMHIAHIGHIDRSRSQRNFSTGSACNLKFLYIFFILNQPIGDVSNRDSPRANVVAMITNCLARVKCVHMGLGVPIALSVITLILVLIDYFLPLRRTVKAKELGENLYRNYLTLLVFFFLRIDLRNSFTFLPTVFY